MMHRIEKKNEKSIDKLQDSNIMGLKKSKRRIICIFFFILCGTGSTKNCIYFFSNYGTGSTKSYLTGCQL